jgi:hypothetical protein
MSVLCTLFFPRWLASSSKPVGFLFDTRTGLLALKTLIFLFFICIVEQLFHDIVMIMVIGWKVLLQSV